jgi:hypothetical protein
MLGMVVLFMAGCIFIAVLVMLFPDRFAGCLAGILLGILWWMAFSSILKIK